MSNTNVHLNLSPVKIVYGNYRLCKYQAWTNHAHPVAKYFIYKCFLNEEPLEFELCKLQTREKKPSLKNI